MNAPVQVTVLVVDDDPTVRELLDDYLSDNGYRVLAAGSGPEARALLEEQAPHLVILDVGLPGEDGLSLARFIREQYDIGILMVSGAGETVDRIIGLEVGADDYGAKPFDLRELRARIKSVLRRYQRDPSPPPPASSCSALCDLPALHTAALVCLALHSGSGAAPSDSAAATGSRGVSSWPGAYFVCKCE